MRRHLLGYFLSVHTLFISRTFSFSSYLQLSNFSVMDHQRNSLSSVKNDALWQKILTHSESPSQTSVAYSELVTGCGLRRNGQHACERHFHIRETFCCLQIFTNIAEDNNDGYKQLIILLFIILSSVSSCFRVFQLLLATRLLCKASPSLCCMPVLDH